MTGDLPRYVKVPGQPGAYRTLKVMKDPYDRRWVSLARKRSSASTRNVNAPDAYAQVKDVEPATLREYRSHILEGDKLINLEGEE